MTPKPNRLHPILWVAAVSVIGFSAVGIGAITGLIPSAGSHQEIRSDARIAAADSQAGDVADEPPPAEPVVRQNTTAGKRTEPSAAHAPSAKPAQSPRQLAVATGCAHCGVIESVRPVQTQPKGSGVGVVAGGLLGGVLGNQVGRGSGRDLATIGGAVLGGIAGNQVEKQVRGTTSYEVTVRMDSGEVEVLRMAQLPGWRAGDRVAVRGGELFPPSSAGG